MPISRYSDDPPLDALLDASAPPAPLAGSLSPADVMALVEAARAQAQSEPLRRTGRRHALAVTAAVVLGLSGVGAAAAAVTQADWRGWAQDPDVVFTYTLPSGAVCEQRIGGTIGASDETVDEARAFFREHDVLAMADVEGEIARMRADDDVREILDDGTEVDASYGTERYKSPDEEYQIAVSRAVGEVFAAELAWQGGALDSYSGSAWCPDAEW